MALLATQFINSQTYTAKQWRYAMRDLGRLQAGIWGSNDMAVTASSGMNVSVAAGSHWQPGTSSPVNTGWYHTSADTPTTVTIPAAHATLPRLDQVTLRIDDVTDGGASGTSEAELVVLTGTATSGSDLDDRLGAATLPAGSVRLADVLVPAASSSVTAANIRDRRTWARGGALRWRLTAGNFATTSTTITSFSTPQRIELTGRPVRLGMTGAWNHNTAGTKARIAFQTTTPGQPSSTFNYVDGRYYTYTFPTANIGHEFLHEHLWTPSAGSHLIRLAYMTETAGTLTVYALDTMRGFYAHVVEEVMASGGNGIT